jgi:hypothetical protein
MSHRQGFAPADRVEADEDEGKVDVAGSFHGVEPPPPLDRRAPRKAVRLSKDRLVQVKSVNKRIAVNTTRLDAIEHQRALLDMAVPGKRSRNRKSFTDRLFALHQLYGEGKIPRGVYKDLYNDTSRTPYYTRDTHEPLGTFY